jgi:SAM-dependent methyltransferase
VSATTTARPKQPAWIAAMDQLQGTVDEALGPVDRPRVLEAGCGSAAYVRFPSTAHITGIDIDSDQLERNTACHEKILGDLETYDLPESSYDAIVCWYVFEHLRFPDHALVRFARAVSPGGVIVLALPNVMTPKGLVTKFTPHWFHIAFRRYVLGRKHAGRPGHGPFPTTIPWTLAPDRLLGLVASCNLDLVFQAYLEDGKQVQTREKLGLTGRRWEVTRRLVARLSRGRLDAARTELLLVLRRPVEVAT